MMTDDKRKRSRAVRIAGVGVGVEPYEDASSEDDTAVVDMADIAVSITPQDADRIIDVERRRWLGEPNEGIRISRSNPVSIRANPLQQQQQQRNMKSLSTSLGRAAYRARKGDGSPLLDKDELKQTLRQTLSSSYGANRSTSFSSIIIEDLRATGGPPASRGVGRSSGGGGFGGRSASLALTSNSNTGNNHHQQGRPSFTLPTYIPPRIAGPAVSDEDDEDGKILENMMS